jgi:hypothetical protein
LILQNRSPKKLIEQCFGKNAVIDIRAQMPKAGERFLAVEMKMSCKRKGRNSRVS